jgi:hypothetical protein
MSLTKHEREQLQAIADHGLTWPGDTISHRLAAELGRRGLCARIEGWWCITAAGSQALTEEE